MGFDPVMLAMAKSLFDSNGGYVSKGKKTVVAVSDGLFKPGDGGASQYLGVLSIEMSDGETYIVNWDGTEHSCKVFYADEVFGLGNPGLLTGEGGNGLSFVFINIPVTESEFDTWLVTTDTAETHSFSVSKETASIYTGLRGVCLPVVEMTTTSGALTDAENSELNRAAETRMPFVIHLEIGSNALSAVAEFAVQDGTMAYAFRHPVQDTKFILVNDGTGKWSVQT